MGRKKKKSDDGVRPPWEENIASKGAEFVRVDTGEVTLDEGGENLANIPKTKSEITDVELKNDKPFDAKENTDKISMKDSTHKRRLFGRIRIRSVSSKRGNAKKRQMRKELQNEASVPSDDKINMFSSRKRMSRKETFYSETPELTKNQISKDDDFKVKATVDPPDKEPRRRKVGREKKSSRDFVNSTEHRRRLSSKSLFKLSQRCPLPSCWENLKSHTKKRRENKNGKQGQLNLTNKHDTEIRKTDDNQKICQVETQSEILFERMPTKRKNVRKTGQRKRVTAKGSKEMKGVSAPSEKQKKPRSAMTNCCGIKKKSRQNLNSGLSDDECPPEVNPISMKPTSTERIKAVGLTSESQEEAVQSSKSEPNDIHHDDYPEELNPFAEEYISENKEPDRNGLSLCGDRFTKPVIQTNSDQTKTVENPDQIRTDDYPVDLNPFADEETNEVEATPPKDEHHVEKLQARFGKPLELNEAQVKSSAVSVDRSKDDAGKKFRLRFRWRRMKATGYWPSMKINRDNESDTKHSKTKATENRSDNMSLSSSGKNSVKQQPVAEGRKSRKWPGNWKRVRSMRHRLTNKKTKQSDVDNTQSDQNSDNGTPVKPVPSLTTSTVDTPETTTTTQNQTWHSSLHIRKRKSSGKKSKKTDSVEQGTKSKRTKKHRIFKLRRNRKHSGESHQKTDKHQFGSVDQLSKYKPKKKRRWFKRKRTQKQLNKSENEALDVETSENTEDHKALYKSKYLQDLNPLTAAQLKSSIKNQPVQHSTQKCQVDTTIKRRRWWKIGKRQKSRDTLKALSKGDEMTNDRPVEPVEDIGGKDTTDLHTKKKSVLNRLKKAFNSRNKSLSSSKLDSGPVICDPKSDDENVKGSPKRKEKVEMKSCKNVKKSLPQGGRAK